MDNGCDKIPMNCDKILFAEDIVSNLINDIYFIEYKPSIATPYREFIYQAYNEDIRMAIIIIHEQVEEYEIMNGLIPSRPTRNKFKKFAKSLLKQYFDRGFDPKLFLYYCVHLLIRAARLTAFTGAQEAGDLAVGYILKPLGDWDMFNGGWSVLNMMAARYRSLDLHLKRESPISFNPSVLGSDDEAPRYPASEEEGSDSEDRLQNADEYRLEVEVGELNRDESSHPRNSNDNQGVAVKEKDEQEVNVNTWLTANKEESKSVQSAFEGSGRLPMEGALAKQVEVPRLDEACTSSEKVSNKIKTAMSEFPNLCLPSSSNNVPSEALLFLNFINSLSVSAMDFNPS